MSREKELYREVLSGVMPDFEQVRMKAKRQAVTESPRRATFRRRWIPVLCAVAGAIVIGSAVPPVRAFITKVFWGTNTAEYLSASESARPELENVAVQTVAPQEWNVRTFADTDLGWADQFTGFEIEEALYDAGELTLRYKVTGALSDVEVNCDNAYDIGEKTIIGESMEPAKCIVQAFVVTDSDMVAPLEESPEETTALAPEGVVVPNERTIAKKSEDGITITSVFRLGALEQDREMELFLSCGMAIPEEPGLVNFERLGFLELPFRIEDGVQETKSAEPAVYTLDGYEIEVKDAALSPTRLSIRYTAPKDAFRETLGDDGVWDFQIYADGELLTAGEGSERVSYLEYLMGDNQDSLKEGLIEVPFPDTTISQVKLVPCTFDGTAISEDSIILTFG